VNVVGLGYRVTVNTYLSMSLPLDLRLAAMC
jgi:hypothetical protein